MKKPLFLLFAVVLGFILALWLQPAPVPPAADNLAAREARWEAERTRLQAALKAARERPVPPTPAPVAPQIIQVVAKLSAAETLQQLRQTKVTRGPGQAVAARRVVVLLENLIALGPESLPVIRSYLATHEDVNYDSDLAGASDAAKAPPPEKEGKADKAAKAPKMDKDGKSLRMLTEFILPPSLVFGLFDATRRIGGAEAERLLADTLRETGVGAEVYYLARALEELAPGRHRAEALAAARELLVNPLVKGRATRIEQMDRDCLYAVLMMFGDRSFLALAKTQLLRADGSTDPSALRYLQLAEPADAIASLAQALRDPRLKDPKDKEPLLKEALGFTGSDPRANQLLHSVVTDDQLPLKLREKSLNDLDKHGFENPDNLTARDQQLVQARLQVLQALRPDVRDPQLTAAWEKTFLKLTGLLADPAARAAQKQAKKAP